MGRQSYYSEECEYYIGKEPKEKRKPQWNKYSKEHRKAKNTKAKNSKRNGNGR